MEPAPRRTPISLVGLEKTLAGLPVVTRRAGETVLSAGLKTDLLLILKKGAVEILKDSIEIAIVDQPGAVLGEISALLDQPHAAEVRALEDSQFYVADAVLLEKDPSAMLYVARIMAERLLAADSGLVILKKQIHADQSSTALKRIVEKVQKILSVGAGIELEQKLTAPARD
jgi:CRP/FNR family transcriptional regulator, cyclic AMP receptor protein